MPAAIAGISGIAAIAGRFPEPLARRLLWVLVALCLAVFAALAPHLVYPDLNLDYPFVDGDSHDWIANGLFFAGHHVRYSGRPPLLPLALALLDRLGLLPWWPVLGLILFLSTVVAFYTLAARLFPAAAAFAAALLLLADYSLQGLALDLMADIPASCLLLWSARAFLLARGEGASAAAGAARPRRYLWSGLLAGLSALTQPMALLLPLAAGVTLAARRRRHLATRWPWIGAALALGCPALWALVRRIAFASYGESLLNHRRLLGFHLSGVRFYAGSLMSTLGTPACLLLAAGIVMAGIRAWRGRDPEPAAASLFALLLFASLLGFVALCYLWDAKRLVVYAVWPAGLLLAEALSPLARLRRPAGRLCFAAVSALAIGGAALPLPEPAHDATWAAVSPLPPLAAHLANGGGVIPLAPADLARWSNFGKGAGAWAARPRPEIRRPSPALFAAADSALYLYDRPEDGGGRYRTLTRLSNALRKPVRFVPRAMLTPYWRLLTVTPLAQIAPDYTIYRLEMAGLAATWLLVTPADRPLDPLLLRPAGTGASPAAPGLTRAVAEATAIAAWVGRGNAYVALLPSQDRNDPVELYLLCLLRTTELYVIEPSAAVATRSLFASSPVESERRFGNARVLATRVRGLRTAVILIGHADTRTSGR
ncbi:MAG TPA: glycosyltransferase family 39 protein [Thermoanaerobaculia bacterium]|nr:glycosyltransferase family 39 protein [Thermoanaerobaculia bacterium]